MAKLWVPNKNAAIDSSENVGRRLFELAQLKGALDQARPVDLLEINHFQEKRLGHEVSLDRLGRTSPEQKTIAFLTPRCEAAGASFLKPRKFHGWAIIQVKELLRVRERIQLSVVASPISAVPGQPYSDNPYHAHIPGAQVQQFAADTTGYILALHLRELFTSHGRLCSADGESTPALQIGVKIRRLIGSLKRAAIKIVTGKT